MGLALRALGQKHAASERELVAAVRTGDDRAFEELFARYRSRITAYVLGMVRDHARAEDITQEVFLSALRRLRDTERPIAFKPWIYEIARNACIDEFRRTRRTSEVSLNGDDESSGPERDLVSKQPTPDMAMENKQRLEALRGAFRGLSETHHRLLVMRELEGLSYAEIAERLEMSKPMVESTLFRARRRLGEEYEDLTSGRRCQQVCEVVDRADARSIKVLGVRARRQVAQHLSHCDDCRRYARLSGADEALFRPPTFADKVAALFPFGWLGPRLGAKFLARKLAGVTHFMGSGAILGRVAAAVLMVAAAGGGVAGVTVGGGGGAKATATDAAAIIKPTGGGSGTPAAGGRSLGATGPLSVGGATLLKQSGGGGGGAQITKLDIGGAAKGHAGGVARGPRHGGGNGSGGALVSASSGAGSPASNTGSGGQHRVLGNGAARGIVKKIVSPIVSHLPSLRNPVGSLPKPKLPSLPAVPSVPVPSPQSVVKNPGATVNGVVGAGKQAVQGVAGSGKQAVQGLLGH